MNIVLIWASNNPDKYWNKIILDLISKWYNIFPVNPKDDFIEWIKTYKDISEINKDFEIIIFVVKPEITLNILQKNLIILQNKKIWCQPWTSNNQVKDFLEKNNFQDYILDWCIMIDNIKK
jgi:predicted CoA-binding protein